MKLINCHITGFGRITDFDYDFNGGLNAICEENGWGKSTMSYFLKAMFYGMEYSPNKKALTERTRFLPWDGSVFGGSLTFEVKGENYRVERTFGKSNKNDTFALYNADTGLKTEDFTENLGVEVFEVDGDSFLKSIFVPQTSVATGMTDSINAKMGNLSDAKDDINKFDQAITRLDEARKNYTRKTQANPGKLTLIKNQIRECNEKLEQLPAVNNAYEQQEDMIEERKLRLRELEKEKAELSTKITVQSKRQEELGVFKAQVENLKAEGEALAELNQFFAQGLPTTEELENIKKLDRKIEIESQEQAEKSKGLLDSDESNRLQDLFGGQEKVPSEEKLQEYQDKCDRLKHLRIESEHAMMSDEDASSLQELKYYFAKKRPLPEEMELASEQAVRLATLNGQVAELTDSYHKLENESHGNASDTKAGRSGILIALIIGIVLLAGAVATFVFSSGFSSLIFSIAELVAGAVLIIVFFVISARKKADKKAAEEEQEEKLAEARDRLEEAVELRNHALGIVKEFLAYFLVNANDSPQQQIAEIQRKSYLYERLLSEEARIMETSSGTLEELSALQVQLYTELAPYERKYGYDLYHDMMEQELINRLKQDGDTYLLDVEKRKELAGIAEQLLADHNVMDRFLSHYRYRQATKPAEKIAEIETNLMQFHTKTKTVEELTRSVDDYRAAHAIEEEIIPVEELQKQMNGVDSEMSEINQLLATERDKLQSFSDQINELEEVAEKLDALKETEADYQLKVDRLEKTYDYLQKAREQFLSKYMKPLQTGLRKYLKLLQSSTSLNLSENDFSLDMDLNVKYNFNGSTKDADYLSAGYKDVVSMCSRLALIDVLYKEERPLIILDDPFTNMDADKIENSLALLKEIAEERQVLYFTCHASRMPR